MNEAINNSDLTAFCGLYCGGCNRFLKGKCPGCAGNEKATWCKIRSCCLENNLQSCAECAGTGINACKYFNNPVSRLFAFIFNSNRAANIRFIQEKGYEAFAREMCENKCMTFKRKE